MIVNSGKFKGRVLAKNSFEHIRPTADIVKQAIFNKLNYIIKDSQVLDLFAGTGGLGIEALSRGAEVVFADKDTRSLNLVKTNLKNLGAQAETVRGDFRAVLKYLKKRKFDIILLDPPYKSGFYDEAMKLLLEYELISEKSIVVCEHDKNEKLIPAGYKLVSCKRYGSKMVSYFNKAYD